MAITADQIALEEPSLGIKQLTYAYPGHYPILKDLTFNLPRGSRCLLIGGNGAGKTTLLQVVAGKFMVDPNCVRILGRPPFHDLGLTSTGELSYLGPQWKRDIAFAGTDVPLQGDLGAGEMIFNVVGVDPERRERLIQLLDIDLDWRMNQVSDGQRRRVQICMGLLKPYEVLLLDEITVDMDVVGRLDLLDFFRQECEERGATILYATHIFDGLEAWLTHIAYIADGGLVKGGPMSELPELHGGKLLHRVEAWLRNERTVRKAAEAADPGALTQRPGLQRPAPEFSSRHMAFFR